MENTPLGKALEFVKSHTYKTADANRARSLGDYLVSCRAAFEFWEHGGEFTFFVGGDDENRINVQVVGQILGKT